MLEYVVVVIDQVLLLRFDDLFNSIFGSTRYAWENFLAIDGPRLQVASSKELQLYLEMMLELLAVTGPAEAFRSLAFAIMASNPTARWTRAQASSRHCLILLISLLIWCLNIRYIQVQAWHLWRLEVLLSPPANARGLDIPLRYCLKAVPKSGFTLAHIMFKIKWRGYLGSRWLEAVHMCLSSRRDYGSVALLVVHVLQEINLFNQRHV